MTQPKRTKRHDRILHSLANTAQIRCDMATGPFDAKAREMDRKWGIDRLPDLVSAATADRWGLAMAQLNEAIEAGDHALTVQRVDACLRGFAIMDAEATAAGHDPSNPEVWEYELDGVLYGIVQDGCEWPAAEAARPGIKLHSLREAVVALKAYKSAAPILETVKRSFPDATITAIRPVDDDLGGDKIPF